MASDSSDSPLVLTPDSTGTSAPVVDISAPNSPAGAKKTRRQTAFYPNMNSSNKQQNPFSKSAAKRESVMALGSIEHLQHYFTKTGLVAKKNPLDKPHHGLVPAIGGLHIPTSPVLLGDIEMPPSPAVPVVPRPAFSPHVKTYEVDPESLLPGVIDDVIAVAQAWRLEDGADLAVPFDVLDVLKTTTRAIRSTRNYLLSLPDESAGTIRSQFRPTTLGPGRLARSKSNSSLSADAAAQDPIILIRRGALDVLTVLRQLEESFRLPLDDEAYDVGSDGGRGAASPPHGALELPPAPPHALELERSSSSLGGAGELSFSLVQVQGRFESVPVWEDDDDGFGPDADEEETRRERWDERLDVGSGWLYRRDIKLSGLGAERRVVGTYLDLVDEVLFEGKKGDRERGWERVRRKREGRASSRAAKRRVSTNSGMDPPSPVRSSSERRRVSTGMIPMMRGMSLTEEPEDMSMIQEEEDTEPRSLWYHAEIQEMIDDEDLPLWAQRSMFTNDQLGRAHALIAYFLPSSLASYLAPPTAPEGSRTAFLASLSSGQLLCMAYNACVRKSKKPWGFVSRDGVHDIIALEKAAEADAAPDAQPDAAKDRAAAKKIWTFRRTDNLRLWAGALKLRYMLPVQVPAQPVPAPAGAARQPLAALMSSSGSSGSAAGSAANSASSTPLPSPGPAQRFGAIGLAKADRAQPILFDARVIAKKDAGWEDMLAGVLLAWVDAVVEERRVFQA